MIFKGDIGTKIILNTNTDLATGSVFKIYYRKPDGTMGSWTAQKESDNTSISYTTQVVSDLNIAGTWVIQSYVEISGWKGYGVSVNMIVGMSVMETPPAPITPALSTTPEDMLAAVNQAIAANLNGGAVQSYSIGGRNIQKATLAELWKMRDDLTRLIGAQKGGGRTYAKFTRADNL